MNVMEQLAVYETELARNPTENWEIRAGRAAGMVGTSPRQIRRVFKLRRLVAAMVAEASSRDLDIDATIDFCKAKGVDADALRGVDARPLPIDESGAQVLYRKLAVLDKVADHRALSINYRVLVLAGKSIHAAAPWGRMRLVTDLGLDSEVCVDAADFIGILRTAPEQPFTVRVENYALHWQCGTARGRLGTIAAEVPVPDYDGELTPLARSFGVGLELGASACGRTAVLRSAGLEGVQLYNRSKRAYAVASDGIVVSSCCLGPALPMSNLAIVTLKPQAAGLLAEVVQRESGEMFIGVDADTLYFLARGIELHLNQLAPLPVNFAEKLKPYTGAKITVPLLHETVSAFLKRAEMLAEIRREAMVEVTVKDGRVTLTFSEAVNQAEEYYDIVPAGPAVTMPPVRVEVRRLAAALDDADYLVFDYAEQNILVLRGENEFIFAIAGKTP